MAAEPAWGWGGSPCLGLDKACQIFGNSGLARGSTLPIMLRVFLAGPYAFPSRPGNRSPSQCLRFTHPEPGGAAPAPRRRRPHDSPTDGPVTSQPSVDRAVMGPQGRRLTPFGRPYGSGLFRAYFFDLGFSPGRTSWRRACRGELFRGFLFPFHFFWANEKGRLAPAPLRLDAFDFRGYRGRGFPVGFYSLFSITSIMP